MITRMLLVVVALFPISEIVLAVVKHSGDGSAQQEDRGSMRLLWISILAGVGLAAVAAALVATTRMHGPANVIHLAALALLLGGLALRWTAILTLGRFFTVDVSIQSGHAVVQRGLYRWMRHPSYTGLMLAFVGLGFFYENWLSLVVILVPITFALLYRVKKEEQALLAALGPDYAAYCARTRRFIPGVF